MQITGETRPHSRLPFYAIPRDQVVLVYCAGGGRSRLTAKELVDGGHQEVYNLEEGIAGWQEEGYPVVTGPSKAD